MTAPPLKKYVCVYLAICWHTYVYFVLRKHCEYFTLHDWRLYLAKTSSDSSQLLFFFCIQQYDLTVYYGEAC